MTVTLYFNYITLCDTANFNNFLPTIFLDMGAKSHRDNDHVVSVPTLHFYFSFLKKGFRIRDDGKLSLVPSLMCRGRRFYGCYWYFWPVENLANLFNNGTYSGKIFTPEEGISCQSDLPVIVIRLNFYNF